MEKLSLSGRAPDIRCHLVLTFVGGQVHEVEKVEIESETFQFQLHRQ